MGSLHSLPPKEKFCLPDSHFRRRRVICAMQNFMRKVRPVSYTHLAAENYAKEAHEHTTANVRYYVKENIFDSEFRDRKTIPDVTRSKAIIQNLSLIHI